MIKNLKICLVASAVLAISAFANFSYAAEPVSGYTGKLENNRVLVPLRDVARHIGADVKWNGQNKTVEVIKDNTTIKLAINSPVVSVNETEVTLDVAVKAYNSGTTYVPLRFFSEALGADVKWNQQTQQATITAAGKQLIVSIDPGQPSASQQATQAQIKQLVDKLNEATDVSAIKQIRTYFSPYFTDKFINRVIQNKGLEYSEKMDNLQISIYYTSPTTGKTVQRLHIGYDDYGDEVWLIRKINVVYVNETWKVDSVSFIKSEIPVSGA